MADRKEEKKQYYIENRERILKRNKQYRKNNPEKVRQYRIKNKDKSLEYKKQWYIKNRDKLSKQHKEWYENHPEKIKEYFKQRLENNPEKIKEYQRQWYIKNREKRLKASKQYKSRIENKRRINKNKIERKKIDLKFNLNLRMGGSMLKSLKANKAGYHWENLVSYNLIDLIKRLNKTMPQGYTWQDYLSGKLHIDHITPIKVFNFTKPEHTDFKRCWALSNLRLLPARENLFKNARLTRPFQPGLQI